MSARARWVKAEAPGSRLKLVTQFATEKLTDSKTRLATLRKPYPRPPLSARAGIWTRHPSRTPTPGLCLLAKGESRCLLAGPMHRDPRAAPSQNQRRERGGPSSPRGKGGKKLQIPRSSGRRGPNSAAPARWPAAEARGSGGSRGEGQAQRDLELPLVVSPVRVLFVGSLSRQTGKLAYPTRAPRRGWPRVAIEM